MNDLTTFLTDNRSRFRDELFEFLRIPSVSARSESLSRSEAWVFASTASAAS